MAIKNYSYSFIGSLGRTASRYSQNVFLSQAAKIPSNRPAVVVRSETASNFLVRGYGQHSLIRAQASSSDEGAEPETGSPAWRSRPPAVTLPAYFRKAEHTFLLAGLLKVLFLSQLFPKGLIFKPLGFMPNGFFAFSLLLPVAAVLALLANALVRSKFIQRKWSASVLFVFCGLAIFGSSKLYGSRPIPQAKQALSRSQTELYRPRESMWSNPKKPRTAEDSDRMFAELDREEKVSAK